MNQVRWQGQARALRFVILATLLLFAGYLGYAQGQAPGYNTLDQAKWAELIAESSSDAEAGQWKVFLERPHPNTALTRQFFDAAADEFGVPSVVLQAIGQVETNWTQIGPSIDQGWGMMHLVGNGYCDTLGEAAGLIGVPADTLIDDAEQNIRGAAALIARYAGPGKGRFTKLEDWFDAVKQFTGLIDDDLREMEAERIYEVIRDGVRAGTLWGEKVVIAPQRNVDIASKLVRKGEREKAGAAKSADYTPAIWNAADASNYGSGRNHAIDTWVNHWIGVGTYAGAISWFKTPVGQGGRTSPSSAHFVIRASDGEITQMVQVADTAWHAGAAGYPYNNTRSIGIEHEATVTNPDQWNSVPMLQASTDLARALCDAYAIPKTRALPGIRGHAEMPGCSTDCPGNLPWTTWIDSLNGTSAPETGAWTGIKTLETKIQEDLPPASVEDGGEVPYLVEDKTLVPLPALLADTASPVYRIGPAGVFDAPFDIRIPVPEGKNPDDLEVYYFSESTRHRGWYLGENVLGWMVPGSKTVAEEDGQVYIQIEVNHSGVFQLGQTVKLKFGSVGTLDLGADGSKTQWLHVGGTLAILALLFTRVKGKRRDFVQAIRSDGR